LKLDQTHGGEKSGKIAIQLNSSARQLMLLIQTQSSASDPKHTTRTGLNVLIQTEGADGLLNVSFKDYFVISTCNNPFDEAEV
jgi:hypothetical protein